MASSEVDKVYSPEKVKGHIILFEDPNMAGKFCHVFNECENLVGLSFNDEVSSFVVLSGNWKMYQISGYRSEWSGTFGPGIYKSATDAGITGDDLSSLRCVS